MIFVSSINVRNLSDKLWRNIICEDNHKTILAGYLFICCIIGLIFKLKIAILQPLTSDTVVPGLIAMEIWNHQNYLLQDMVLPAPDPNILEDTIFFFIPQVLSDFNPFILKISGFSIFLFIILIFSLLLYKFLKNKTAILFFIAMMASCCSSTEMRDSTYYYASKYLLPVFHNSTVFFFGLLTYLLFVKKWDSFPHILIPTIILAIVSFSDSLLVIWFVVPLMAMYCFSWGTKYQPKFLFVSVCVLISIAAHFVKYFNPMFYEYADFSFRLFSRTSEEFLKFTLLFQTYLVPDFCYNTLIPGIIVIVGMIGIFLILAVVVKRSNIPDDEKGLLIFSISSIVCTMAIIITFSEMDAWPYISQIPILMYIIATVLIFRANHFVTFLKFLLVMLVSVNLIMLSSLAFFIPESPNSNETELIDILTQHGVTHAFANFWDANLITYLSHESVKVRAVEYVGILAPFIELSDIRWFEEQRLSEKPLTLIVKNSETKDLLTFIASHPPDRFNDLGYYSALQYDSLNSTAISEVPDNWREKLGSTTIGLSRILEKFSLLTNHAISP